MITDEQRLEAQRLLYEHGCDPELVNVIGVEQVEILAGTGTLASYIRDELEPPRPRRFRMPSIFHPPHRVDFTPEQASAPSETP